MSVSIYTITHMPFTPPSSPVYIPLQVGRAIHPDYGYLGDDTGDNISDKNTYYSELTGLYWIWKNRTDSDYLGLCHYRRYFLNDNGELMTQSDYEKILSAFDVIIAKSQTGPYDYKTIYSRSHDIRNLDLVGEVIRELYPDYSSTFEEVIAGNHCYVGNLFVAPRELFCAYCEWLFTIFFAMESRIDTTGYDDYHKRLFGFLSEQLLIVWIKYNNLTYYEAPFGLSQEKAETIELKEQLRKDFKEKDIIGAYQRLCDTLDRRPDLILDISDFNKELQTIEHILNVCRIELEYELPTMLAFSDDLDLLVKHFNLLVQIVEHMQKGILEEKELQYLLDCQVSHKTIIYIMQNMQSLSGEPITNPLTLLNQLAILYAGVQNPLSALSFLEEALQICDTDVTTFHNIADIFEQMGQSDAAAEYRQLAQQLTDSSPANMPAESGAPKKLRLVVFYGSQISIINFITCQYIKSLEKLGHTVLLFDKTHFDESTLQLAQWQEQGLDAAIVFHNIGFEMRLANGQSLWDIWQVPVFNLIMDHPMYYADTLDNSPKYGIVACADRYHRDYCKRFYSTVQKAIFLPTAGECLKTFLELKPFGERSIEVLFIGSYKYNDLYAANYDDIDRYLEQELQAHPRRLQTDVIEDFLKTGNMQWSDVKIKAFIESKHFIDLNVTSLFRRKIMETLIHAGIPVTVYGDGWDRLEIFHYPNFIFKGTILPEDGVALMEDAKIVLNQLTWFKAGASERIFEAMLQGAVSLTDDSEYLREQFTDGEDIRFYSLEHLEKLPELTQELLTNTDLCERIRRSAYEKAAANHTWDARAKELLTHLS